MIACPLQRNRSITSDTASGHIIGPDASTLVQEVVVAMTAGSGTVRDIRSAVHIHPALPEVVQRAFSGGFTHGDGDHHHH